MQESKIHLQRVLGLGAATMLVAGNIIGMGIFKKVAPMAASGLSGTAILAAWLVAGMIALLAALNMAGLARLTTKSGGIYEYLRLSFGGFPAFLFGWSHFSIQTSGSLAAASIVVGEAINSFHTIPNPASRFENFSVGNVFPFAGFGIKIMAVAILTALTWINYRGVKKGAILNNFLTTGKVLGILLIILAGLFFFSPSQNNISTEPPVSHPAGISFFVIFFGIMINALLAYDGFGNVGAVAAEIKNPKRNIPRAIIFSMCVVIGLYMLVNFVFIKWMPVSQLGSLGQNQIAAAVIGERILGDIGGTIISILILMSVLGFLNVALLVAARYYFRMAQENAFFKKAAKVHPKYKTPYIALVYSLVWSCILILTGSFDILTDMVVIVSFGFHFLSAMALIKMKRNNTIKEKIAGYPWAPVLFMILISAVLVSTFINDPVRSVIGVCLVFSGVPFYYLFKREKRKRLRVSQGNEVFVLD